MVDVHSHILWQLDDGATSFEESLAMLRVAQDAGTTDIVATPHANQQYEFNPASISERIQLLTEVPDVHIKIHRGCDFHLMYENIVDALEKPAKYTIDGGPYLLAELPDFTVPPSVDNILARLVAAGLIPVITHPERNRVVARSFDRISRWIEMGCLVQVTAASITGLFGRSAKSAADEMLRRQLVHVIASDAHDSKIRNPRLDEAHNIIASRHGDVVARRLFYDIPSAIIAGRPVDPDMPTDPSPNRRSWWPFGSRSS